MEVYKYLLSNDLRKTYIVWNHELKVYYNWNKFYLSNFFYLIQMDVDIKKKKDENLVVQ